MNKKVLFFFLMTCITSLESSQKIALKKYPFGITDAQKLIIDGNNNYIAQEFENAETVQDKFEIAIFSGKFEYLMSLPTKNWVNRNLQKMNLAGNNTVYLDDLVDLEIDPYGTQSKPLHVAIKIASYHRTYLGPDHIKYKNMLKTIQHLVDKNANPNAEDKSQKTPLHIACQLNELQGATIILTNVQANPLAKDSDNKMPLEYLRKNSIPQEIYKAFVREFNQAIINIKIQNKLDVEKIVATTKISPTPIVEEPAVDPSLPRYKSARNKPVDLQAGTTTDTKPKRNLRTAPRPASASQESVRPSSAAQPVVKNSENQSNRTDGSDSNKINVNDSGKNVASRTSKNLETRYLTPGLASTQPNRARSRTSSQSSAQGNSTNLEQASLATTQSNIKPAEPILIISPTQDIINSPAFATPIKTKPTAPIDQPAQSKSIYSTIRGVFFGSSQQVAPMPTPSPRTESTISSPAQSESGRPETHVTIKPSFTPGKSSSKIYAL